jgi:hypothetical protein
MLMNSPRHATRGINRTAILSLSYVRVVNLIDRLVYLASLRDPESGRYEPNRSVVTLSSAFNQDLTRWHEEVFREWVAYTLVKMERPILRRGAGYAAKS